MNKAVISLIEIVLALLLIVLIVIQSKGVGLGSTFGGDMGFYGTKRGAEKLIFIITIIVVVLFFIASIIGIIV